MTVKNRGKGKHKYVLKIHITVTNVSSISLPVICHVEVFFPPTPNLKHTRSSPSRSQVIVRFDFTIRNHILSIWKCIIDLIILWILPPFPITLLTNALIYPYVMSIHGPSKCLYPPLFLSIKFGSSKTLSISSVEEE